MNNLNSDQDTKNNNNDTNNSSSHPLKGKVLKVLKDYDTLTDELEQIAAEIEPKSDPNAHNRRDF